MVVTHLVQIIRGIAMQAQKVANGAVEFQARLLPTIEASQVLGTPEARHGRMSPVPQRQSICTRVWGRGKIDETDVMPNEVISTCASQL